MKKTVSDTVYAMLTENTGRSILDSGGAYGRNWEHNQRKTKADFEAEPSASIDVSIREWQGKPTADLTVTVSVYHMLTENLGLDSYCHEYNAQPVGNWNGDYYGTDSDQCEWLSERGFVPVGEAFNTYNWASDHSQILQGQALECEGQQYVLLQIHGGCDARGGYTDAKLFTLRHDCIESILVTDCGFSAELPNGEYISLSYYGEWIDADGGSAGDEYLLSFANAIGEGVHAGDAFYYN